MRFLLTGSAMGGSSPVMNIDPNIFCSGTVILATH
jgi:hypothetical protein